MITCCTRRTILLSIELYPHDLRYWDICRWVRRRISSKLTLFVIGTLLTRRLNASPRRRFFENLNVLTTDIISSLSRFGASRIDNIAVVKYVYVWYYVISENLSQRKIGLTGTILVPYFSRLAEIINSIGFKRLAFHAFGITFSAPRKTSPLSWRRYMPQWTLSF